MWGEKKEKENEKREGKLKEMGGRRREREMETESDRYGGRYGK